MRNLKISKKLIISYAIVLILLIAGTLVSVFNLVDIGNQVEDFYNGPYTVKGLANNINAKFEEMQKYVFRAISSEDPGIAQDSIDKANAAGGVIQEQLPILESSFQGDVQLITDLKADLQELKPMREAVLELASQNLNAEASAYMETNNAPKIKEAQQQLTSIMEFADDRGAALIEVLNSSQSRSTLILIAFGVVSVLISIFFGVYITKSITKPVAELEAAAENLSNGNLNATITYQSRDELGHLAESMRLTVRTLREYIDDIGHGMASLAGGDLSVNLTMDYKGDFITLRDNIHSLVESLNDTMTQINQSADQVASGSDQVSSGAQALSQGATEQASSVEELAATITEISNQVRSNAENANQANQAAEEVGGKVFSSNSKMQEMIQAMGEISQSSGEIGKIIKTIEDIAFQTNILALNAAVEAARAGAAGKGFAVVADEVRNLASKSADASKNTSALIESSLKSVERGTAIADDTAKALMEVVEGAKFVTGLIVKIADASNDQAQSIAQVTQGVDQISSVVQTNSATAEESAAASEELSGQAQMLRELVGRFKLRNSSQGPSLEYHYEDAPVPSMAGMGSDKY